MKSDQKLIPTLMNDPKFLFFKINKTYPVQRKREYRVLLGYQTDPIPLTLLLDYQSSRILLHVKRVLLFSIVRSIITLLISYLILTFHSKCGFPLNNMTKKSVLHDQQIYFLRFMEYLISCLLVK